MTMDKIPRMMQYNSLPEEVRDLIASVFSTEDTQNCLCEFHSDSEESRITARLLRLMLVILNLASDLARERKLQENLYPSDLELMFHGGGRGGFQWLECLAKDDGGWIEDVTGRCPGCVLGRAFESECTIRLLIIAARLVGDGLDFYVAFIRDNLLEDPWWGPGYWETIEPKAALLEGQLRELLAQCSAMRRSLEDGAKNIHRRIARNATAVPLDVSTSLVQALERSLGGKAKSRENYQLAVYTWFGLLFGDLALSDPSLSGAIVQRYLSSRLTRSLTV